jgi:hypothetical protein
MGAGSFFGVGVLCALLGVLRCDQVVEAEACDERWAQHHRVEHLGDRAAAKICDDFNPGLVDGRWADEQDRDCGWDTGG